MDANCFDITGWQATWKKKFEPKLIHTLRYSNVNHDIASSMRHTAIINATGSFLKTGVYCNNKASEAN